MHDGRLDEDDMRQKTEEKIRTKEEGLEAKKKAIFGMISKVI